MKLSEITWQDVTEFARLPDETEGLSTGAMLAAARDYVLTYTGLTEEAADQHESLAVAALVLCADLYDNRSMTVDKANVNKTVTSILDLHSVNLV